VVDGRNRDGVDLAAQSALAQLVDLISANGWLGRDTDAKAAIAGLLKLKAGVKRLHVLTPLNPISSET
jgi:hypothetical protein